MRFVVFRLAAAAAIAGLLATGCATQTQSHVTELRRSIPNPRIILMPLDVELMEMNVGGVYEPKPEWTETARNLITDELRIQKTQLGFSLQELSRDFKGTPAEEELVDQLSKVHALVGRSVRLHRRLMHLPSLGENPRWSLGAEVRVLHDKTGADYALFVHLRDSYASDARKIAMVAGLAFGIGLMGGLQEGFASLVDLKTGDVVWFNELGRPTGDLRSPESAGESVKILLTDFPK